MIIGVRRFKATLIAAQRRRVTLLVSVQILIEYQFVMTPCGDRLSAMRTMTWCSKRPLMDKRMQL